MSSRRAYDEAEHARVKAPVGDLGFGPLFEAPAPAPVEEEWTGARWSSLTDVERKAQRARWCERLEPLLDAMLLRRPREHGITAAELVDEAMRSKDHEQKECRSFGVILPEGLRVAHPKIFAFVGPWLAVLARRGRIAAKTARLEEHGSIHLKREAARDEAHGNQGLIYIRPAKEQAA